MTLVFERNGAGVQLETYCDRCAGVVGSDDGVAVCLPFDAELVQPPLFLHRLCLEEWLAERVSVELPAVIPLVALPHILLEVLMVTAQESERAVARFADWGIDPD